MLGFECILIKLRLLLQVVAFVRANRSADIALLIDKLDIPADHRDDFTLQISVRDECVHLVLYIYFLHSFNIFYLLKRWFMSYVSISSSFSFSSDATSDILFVVTQESVIIFTVSLLVVIIYDAILYDGLVHGSAS